VTLSAKRPLEPRRGLFNSDKYLIYITLHNRVAFAFIFGGNGRIESRRFSYVGSSYRQLAQLIFFGKDVVSESLNRTD
jgi:hypothetical protein